ncbi:MAG: hypothetical protein JSS91_00865 [Bacteroidetes bacterium]|nr:hypothetical protein [Bacteroidota bacterium]
MKQIDCPHCYKINVFLKIIATCPYCNKRYGGFTTVESLLTNGCSSCKSKIKYISCAYCKGKITVNPDLPEERILICETKDNLQNFKESTRNLVKALDEGSKAKDPEVDAFFEKVGNAVNSLSHLFLGEKILKVTTSQAENIKIKADAFLAKAKGDDAIYRAELIKKASEMIDDIPAELRPYVINTILGKDNTEPADKLANDSKLQSVVIEIERQKLRKEQIDNDDRERKARENI